MLELASATLVALAVLFGLGFPVARAVGLRGLWAYALAPAFTMSAIAATALLAPAVGIGWSVIPVLVTVALMAGLLWVVRRIVMRGRAPRVEAPERVAPWWTIGALAGAALIIATQVMMIVGNPEHFSQTYDNIFHLNATRYVLDLGNASPLFVGTVADYSGQTVFYPSGWHALTALICQLTGASIPVVFNAVTLAVAAVVWPAGALLLSRTLFGSSVAATVSTAMVAVSIPTFPLLLIDYGVLYPLLLGFSLLSSCLALTLAVFKIDATRSCIPAGWAVVAAIGCIPGIAVSHPGALIAWVVMSLPIVTIGVVTVWRLAHASGQRIALALGYVLYLGAVSVSVFVLRPPAEARTWPPDRRMREAVVDILTVDLWHWGPVLIVAVAAIVGIIWALCRHTPASLAAVGMYGVGAVLMFFVTSAPWLGLRDVLTGPWYNNIPRIAALLTIVTVPLAAFGISSLWQAIADRIEKKRAVTEPSFAFPGRSIVGAVCAALLLAAMQVSVMPKVLDWARHAFELTDDSPLVNTKELALIERIPDTVPEDARIAGFPWTGTSLAYALEDRRVLAPHVAITFDEQSQIVVDRLDEVHLDPATICPALAAYDIEYVLDFGRREVHGADNMWRFPGLDNLANSAALELIDSEGDDAKLYRITACDFAADDSQ